MIKKKRLITSALPYVNNSPHLGNIVGAVLSADVFARFSRLADYEVLYVCGTDGYGTATETKAALEGKTPEDICNTYHKLHKQVYENFDIKFDVFGKTFTPDHNDLVQEIFLELDKNGLFIEKETDQVWCEECQRFLADRFVYGQCPKCNYDDARGDQCDSCGSLLNSTDLLDPQCRICNSKPIQKTSKHLFIDLETLSDKITSFAGQAEAEKRWSNNAIGITKSWLNAGLKPRPITRDLKWGVPVPKEGFQSKVFYVWFDAPIGYISITKKAHPNDWQTWWKNPDQVDLYQFMGKDNVPFHTVMFPATLMESAQTWTLPKYINSTEYLNYENSKFSKSRGTGVFGEDVEKIGLPIDFWRFYLMAIRPESHDSSFDWDDFVGRINNELIDNICNLVNRTLTFYTKKFSANIDAPNYSVQDLDYLQEIKQVEQEYYQLMDSGRLRDGLQTALKIGSISNRFFHSSAPWKQIKESPDSVKFTIIAIIHVVRDISIMLEPFTPGTSQRIQTMLGTNCRGIADMGLFDNLTGNEVKGVEILHKKIDPDLAVSLRDRFANQNDG